MWSTVGIFDILPLIAFLTISIISCLLCLFIEKIIEKKKIKLNRKIKIVRKLKLNIKNSLKFQARDIKPFKINSRIFK